MRIFILLLILFPAVIFSQDSTIKRSKFEEFTSATGQMIKTEIFDAGSQKDFKVSVVKATNLETGESKMAVQLYKDKNMFLVGPYKSSYLYIDWDELPGFIKAVKFQQPLMESKPKNEVDYTYTTENGVATICSFNLSDGYIPSGWSIQFFRVYTYLRSTVNESAVLIKKKELDDIIKALEQAIKKDY